MDNNYLNAIAGHGGSLILYVSLADGPLEVDELAVTRQSITWGAALSGDIAATNQPEFNVLGGSTVNHVQYWSAATTGTYYGSSSVTEESFGGDGVYTLQTAEIQHNAVV